MGFYRSVFGWRGRRRELGTEFSAYDLEHGNRGIGGAIQPTSSTTNTTLFAFVDDVQTHLQRAQSLGATVTDTPTMATDDVEVGFFVDHDGHIFGIMHSPRATRSYWRTASK